MKIQRGQDTLPDHKYYLTSGRVKGKPWCGHSSSSFFPMRVALQVTVAAALFAVGWSCVNVPTVDTIELSAYFGQWCVPGPVARARNCNTRTRPSGAAGPRCAGDGIWADWACPSLAGAAAPPPRGCCVACKNRYEIATTAQNRQMYEAGLECVSVRGPAGPPRSKTTWLPIPIVPGNVPVGQLLLPWPLKVRAPGDRLSRRVN